MSILELLQIEKIVGPPTPKRCGRKLAERRAVARAFVSKAVYNHPTTRATREALRNSSVFRRICGFVTAGDIPSEATFSRAFAEFAKQGLGDRAHEALVESCVKTQLTGTGQFLRGALIYLPSCQDLKLDQMYEAMDMLQAHSTGDST